MNDTSHLPGLDPEHDSLARFEGHLRGVRRMVVEGRCCADILVQIRAVRGALSAVERNLLEAWVREPLPHGSIDDLVGKVRETLALFAWNVETPAR